MHDNELSKRRPAGRRRHSARRTELATLAGLLRTTAPPMLVHPSPARLPRPRYRIHRAHWAFRPQWWPTISSAVSATRRHKDRGARQYGGTRPDFYNICYVNGFQTQPGERDLWLVQRRDLILIGGDGRPHDRRELARRADRRHLDIGEADPARPCHRHRIHRQIFLTHQMPCAPGLIGPDPPSFAIVNWWRRAPRGTSIAVAERVVRSSLVYDALRAHHAHHAENREPDHQMFDRGGDTHPELAGQCQWNDHCRGGEDSHDPVEEQFR